MSTKKLQLTWEWNLCFASDVELPKRKPSVIAVPSSPHGCFCLVCNTLTLAQEIKKLLHITDDFIDTPCGRPTLYIKQDGIKAHEEGARQLVLKLQNAGYEVTETETPPWE